MPEPGREAESMDQTAGEAMRLAAELVSVGTMATAQQVRLREQRTEEARRRVLQETRDARRHRSAMHEAGEQDKATAETEGQPPVGEARTDQEVSADQEAAPGVDPEATAPSKAAAKDMHATAPIDVAGQTVADTVGGPGVVVSTAEAFGVTIEQVPGTPPPAAAERAVLAELASSRGADPAQVAKALVDVGAMPRSSEGLPAAGGRFASQPRPSRSVGLGRSALPGHDVSR